MALARESRLTLAGEYRSVRGRRGPHLDARARPVSAWRRWPPLPTSGGASVPASPQGASGLHVGVTQAAGSYQQTRSGAATLDQELQQAAEQGGAIGAQGRFGSG